MINFIVVEDHAIERKQITKTITKYMMKNKYEFDVLEFEDFTNDLVGVIENKEYNHIYILDFELPSATAIDIARKIRETDWTSPIIIHSVYGGMAYESFKQRLQILDFVSKKINVEKNMFELFDICIKQLKITKSLKCKINGVDYNIDFNNILYIYRDTSSRKIVIVTNHNEYKMFKSLSAIKNELDDRFKYTHKACIVNTDRVEAYVWSKNKIIFDNEEEIFLLSKTHKKELENNVVV